LGGLISELLRGDDSGYYHIGTTIFILGILAGIYTMFFVVAQILLRRKKEAEFLDSIGIPYCAYLESCKYWED
jgi:hypothetical protein